MPNPLPKHFFLLQMVVYMVTWKITHWFKCRARNIRTNFIFGGTLINDEVGKAVYKDFLPKALAGGTYMAAPDPCVVGKGLEYIQAGFDLQKKGMSAKKVVVSL